MFDLARDPSYDPDEFLVAPSNAAAHAAVERWPAWPTRCLILVGPPGSGKSHLAAIWAARSNARVLSTEDLASLGQWGGPVVALLEDCCRTAYDQTALFHLVNMVGEGRGSLLITARSAPATWNVEVPDLLSRLRAAQIVELRPPDANLVKAVIIKLFADRQIRIDEDVVNYAALHCEQSLDAVSSFVAAVDEDALASGRRVTRHLAARTMSRLTTSGD